MLPNPTPPKAAGPKPHWTDWPVGVRIGLLAVVYLILGRIGLEFATVSTHVSPVFPASGLALAALIVGGLRLWPGVWIGALATAVSTQAPLAVALSIATGNTLEPVATVLLLRWVFEYRGDFERPRHVVGFITLFGLVGTPVSTLFGAGSLVLAGRIGEGEFARAAVTWWAGNFTGGLILAPLIIAANQIVWRPQHASRAREFLGLLIVLFLLGGTVFLWGLPGRPDFPALAFLPFPVLVWIAWSFGIGGAAMSALVMSCIAIWGTTRGQGPFGHGSSDENIGLLLVYITVVSMTSLVLAAFNAQRERVVERLRQREWQLTEAQRIGNLGVWLWDLRTEHFRLSDGGLRIIGESRSRFSPTVGAFPARVHPEDQTAVDESLRKVRLADRTENFDCRVTRPDGEIRHVTATGALLRDHRGEPAMLLGTLLDVSDRKRLEADQANLQRKLLETQKLESLGLLAGGIAHDFNNILTGILGNASLLRLQLPPESPMHEGLGRIETSAERAADLCRQMLAYSGKGKFFMRATDLNEVVRATWALLQTSISKKIELSFTPSTALPAVMADGLQLRQVIMNLVVNAGEALPDGHGRVTIRTGTMMVDRTWLAGAYMAPEIPEGEYVFLEVEDTGVGMAPDVLAKIFDPFFTTKFTGRGLGLAAVAGIVRAYQGAVRVTSTPGFGSTFRVVFKPTNEPAAKKAAPAPAPITPTGRGTLLIVDDEESIRHVASEILGKNGYTTVQAADGVAALEILGKDGRDFRVVLLDFSMPRLDGVETFKRIRETHRQLPVVLMSGYDEEDAMARFAGLGLAGFVQKPFTSAGLQDAIRKAAASNGSGAS